MDDQQFFEDVILNLFQNPEIRERSFYPAFRRCWVYSFRTALENKEPYFSADSPACICMERTIENIPFTFHLDQLKMADWYQKEQAKHKKIVFIPKRFKRSREGVISYDDAVCTYDASLPETSLNDINRNIFAAAKPGFPPELQIVYGNKWVEGRFNRLIQRSLQLYWIQTDYVPAFLQSPFEVCLYLFLMDYCIIKEDHEKVKDEDLQKLLHIFRPSPMLQIKKLIAP